MKIPFLQGKPPVGRWAVRLDTPRPTRQSGRMSRPTAPGPVKLTQKGRFPNCNTIAREFDVSDKRIQRDIDFMRDRPGRRIFRSRSISGARLASLPGGTTGMPNV